MKEEEAERAEQDEMERQERNVADMQARQQQAELEEQRAEAEEVVEEERDLDDEIPDADAEASTVDASVTFNEDSMVEGSHLEAEEEQYAVMEEAELTGAAQDEEDLGMEMERDLDDSVPEAGSYQHTDTELEESDSSDSGDIEVMSTRPPPRTSTPASQQRERWGAGMGLQERMRAQVSAADSLPRSPGSLNLSSSILDSSMLQGSSPVVQRSNNGGRQRPAQRGRGGRSRYS